MQTIRDSHSLSLLINSSPKLLVYFGATWCAPCKKFLPIVTSFAANNALGVKCAKVDVDDFEPPNLNINSVPTIMLYRNGANVSTSAGVQNEESFRSWMNHNFKYARN